MNKTLIIWVLIAFGLLIIFKFGRRSYMPIVQKVKGRETVASRVADIQTAVWDRLADDLGKAGFKMGYPSEIIIAAFKEERILQVYGKDSVGIRFLKEYPFTAFSGGLGPKLKEGDRQIPEGIYEVEYLNPNSSFYLSIKVNYPNEFDKAKTSLSSLDEMGGDIFIHGKSSTIGCIPIGDEAIEELFLLTSKAIHHRVKVIISPRDFRIHEEYPIIEHITWETELYNQVKKELKSLPNKN